MIYERLDQPPVHVSKLAEEFRQHVERYSPVMNKPQFGGWSILSATGSYRDGWQAGHLCYKTLADGSTYYDQDLAREMGMRPASDHIVPTEIATPYVQRLIAEIRANGLQPCRVRWTVLKAESSGAIHRDAPDGTYAVRLHIPVITNPMCIFSSEGEEDHAPADGGMYLVRVNRLHQIINRSRHDRYHIIMDVTDKHAISKYHRFGS